MFRGVLFSFLILLFSSAPAFAVPAVDATLSRDKIRVDETALLKIQLKWPAQEGPYTYGLPQIPLENLKLANQSQSQESYIQNGEEWATRTFELELQPENPGPARIPDFQILYVNPVTPDAKGQLQVYALKIQVTKVPFHIPSGVLLIAAGLSLIVMGSVLAVRLMRRPKPAEAPDATVAAMAKALEDLHREETSVAHISRIFRELLASHYPTVSARFSESEMIEALRAQKLPQEEWRSLQKLLGNLEEAKFMGPISNETDLKQLQKAVRDYIEHKRIVGSPA